MTNPSLRELIGAPVPLRVGALTLLIKPMGWYQGSAAIEHLLPAASQLPLLGAESGAAPDRVAQWASLVITFRDEIAAFCAEASALPIEDIRELSTTDMIELVIGLVEINLDFFVQSLPGLAQRARGRLGSLTERLGPALEQIAEAANAADSSTSSSA